MVSHINSKDISSDRNIFVTNYISAIFSHHVHILQMNILLFHRRSAAATPTHRLRPVYTFMPWASCMLCSIKYSTLIFVHHIFPPHITRIYSKNFRKMCTISKVISHTHALISLTCYWFIRFAWNWQHSIFPLFVCVWIDGFPPRMMTWRRWDCVDQLGMLQVLL